MFFYVWELPQNILGLILKLVYTRKKMIEKPIKSSRVKGSVIYYLKHVGRFAGVSLGSYIFVNSNSINIANIVRHEEGHCKQSKLLGPFYLLLVGLPSLILVLMANYISPPGENIFAENYFKMYPENWADSFFNNDKA